MPYIMDTCIVSEVMKPKPDEKVLDWMMDHPGQLYLTTVSVMEMNYGVMLMPEGKRKRHLKEHLDIIVKDCGSRLLEFDGFSSYLCAELRVRARRAGRTPQLSDLMIAAIAMRHNAVLATRNVRDFDYLQVVDYCNPFDYRTEVLDRLLREESERKAREGAR